MYYAGIGSRTTPAEILDLMKKFAQRAAHQGWILRSGAAPGADTAFERGADAARGKKEIYLPYDDYCGRSIREEGVFVPKLLENYQQAVELAEKYHPDFAALDEYKEHIIRDGYQVLGQDLKTPVKLIICWTVDGCLSHQERTALTGGTGQAISLASERNIPIYNLQLTAHREKLISCLDEKTSLIELLD